MPPRCRFTLIAALGLTLIAGLAACTPTDAHVLTLATTTSTYDSGLLDDILPVFEDTYNARVDVIAVGTGQAYRAGRGRRC